MDRGAWWATVHAVARVRQDWVTNTIYRYGDYVMHLIATFTMYFLPPAEVLSAI